ncbi:hypothetical protein JCM8547_001554 [Rhodosporidiobolus lusitaniae]
MEATPILDFFYIGITVVIALPLQGAVWMASCFLRSSTILICGTALNGLVITFTTFFAGMASSLETRNIVASALMMIYTFHMFVYGLVRFFKLRAARKVHAHASKSPVYLPDILLPYPLWLSLPFVLVLPFAVFLPLALLNSPRVVYPGEGGTHLELGYPPDIIGIIMLFVGWIVELVALYTLLKQQLARARSGPLAQDALRDADNAPLALRTSFSSAGRTEEGRVPALSGKKSGFASRLPSPYLLLSLSIPTLTIGLWLLCATQGVYAFHYSWRESRLLHPYAASALLGCVPGPVIWGGVGSWMAIRAGRRREVW